MISVDDIRSQINATSPQRGKVASNQLDKNAFLRLLTAQLQNQDPLNPTDQENFVQQVATFSNLEQQITMNEQFSKLLQFQLVGQAASLIGQQVTGFVNGEVVEGAVKEVIFLNGEPILALENGGELPHSALISIGARKPEASTGSNTDTNTDNSTGNTGGTDSTDESSTDPGSESTESGETDG